MTTSYERLKKFIAIEFNGSIKEFAEEIGIHPNTITTYKERGTVLPPKHRNAVEKAGLNWEWYEFGTGEMYSAGYNGKKDFIYPKNDPRISNVSDVEEVYELLIPNLSKLPANKLSELIKRIKEIGEEIAG